MRKFFSNMFFLLFKLFILVFIAGILSTIINPKFFWPLAFIGLGFPITMLIIFLFFLYWLFTKNKKIIYPIVIFAITAFTVPNFFNLFLKKGKSGENSIKVMSYNVRNFEVYDRENQAEKRDEIIELIQSQQPDILCLQEAYNQKDYILLKNLGKRIGLPNVYMEVGTNSRNGGEFGVAVLSKYRINSTKSYPFGSGGNVATKVDLEIDSTIVSVFNMHLESANIENSYYNYSSESQEELSEQVLLKRAKIVSQQLKEAFEKRSQQAKLMHNEIKETDNPVIVCGDFNDPPMSYAYKKVKGNLSDTFKKGAFGIGATYPAIPFLRIDHIFVSTDFKIESHNIIKKEISDHYPVISHIKLKE